MISLRDMVGWPVMSRDGRTVARITTAVVNRDMVLVGLIASTESGAAFISCNDLAIGEGLVWIPDTGCFKKPIDGEELEYEKLLGTRVIDTSGRDVGVVSDFAIDPAGKSISKIELSDGIISDFLRGRNLVDVTSTVYDGDLIVMSPGERS